MKRARVSKDGKVVLPDTCMNELLKVIEGSERM